MFLFQGKQTTPEAACGRKTLLRQCRQGFTCEELQFPGVMEGFYLQGAWEGLPSLVRTPPATGHSLPGEAKKNL